MAWQRSQITLPAISALSAADALALPLNDVAAAVEPAADTELRAAPYALLHLARLLEPGLRLVRRTAALDRLERLRSTLDDPIGRELRAERAIDDARNSDLDPSERAARDVLASAGPDEQVGRARASEALGRVLAWRGDEMSARAAERVLTETAQAYAELGCRLWHGHVVFWRGNAVRYQHGDLVGAEADMRESLQILDPHSPRRGVILSFLADLLTMRGDWEGADAAFAEAAALAVEHDDEATSGYVAWGRARVASMCGDAEATERALQEAELHPGDWLASATGTTYLADAAEQLDRVGCREAADAYLQRAMARDAGDEFVLQARAALLARRGDPVAALTALRELTHAPWLEVRLTWRRSLLSAYAMLRAGHDGVGSMTSRALDQAAALGDPRIALIGEADIAQALLPLAAQSGSTFAEQLLSPPDGFVIRTLGQFSVRRGEADVALPAGRGAAIVRLLTLHPAGLDADEVIEVFWPDEDPESGRRRLRSALSRLRGRAGGLVVRAGARLRLAPAWIDATAFRASADRALTARGRDAESLAIAALALWTGDLLPTDPYESWAVAPREQLRRRRLDLLDLIAAAALARGSLNEARLAAEQAIEADPYDESRYLLAAQALVALGRREPARRLLDRAVARLRELGLDPTPELRRALAELASSPSG